MPSSFFTYSIQRSYPFAWFTPVAIIGGVLLTALFSVLEVAVNGYQLQPSYRTDPNGTHAEAHWFTQGLFSWNSKFVATCQAQNLQPGTQFFTSNLGLTYTLTGVSTIPPIGQAASTLPVLAYLNNTLEDCHIDYVQLDFQPGGSTTTVPSPWYVWTSSSAVASGHCIIAGAVNVSFSVPFQNPVGLAGMAYQPFTYVLDTNYSQSSSIWWGTRLVTTYWRGCLAAIGRTNYINNEGNTNPSLSWAAATIRYYVVDEEAILSTDMFSLYYSFLDDTNGVTSTLINLYNNANPLSAIMTEGLGWSKAWYSLILADLGQSTLPTLLSSDDNLQYALRGTNDIFRNQSNEFLPQYNGSFCSYSSTEGNTTAISRLQDCARFYRITAPNDTDGTGLLYRMDRAYNIFKSQMGPLKTNNATIYSQYVCSVPVRKGNLNVILAVILGDLVFLSAMWSLYNLIVGSYLRRQDCSADACLNCLAMDDQQPLSSGGGEIGLRTRPRGLSRATSGDSSLALLRPSAAYSALS